jgi:hypothetical protein
MLDQSGSMKTHATLLSIVIALCAFCTPLPTLLGAESKPPKPPKEEPPKEKEKEKSKKKSKQITFVSQPRSQTNVVGDRVVFEAEAVLEKIKSKKPPERLPLPKSKSQKFNYQWWFNGHDIAGATSTVHTIEHVQESDAGEYRLFVYNKKLNQTSDVATLTVQIPIVTEPADQVLVCGGSVTFSVTTGGVGPYTYQWLFNGLPIAGATHQTLTLDQLGPADLGLYQVIVTAGSTSIISRMAALTAPELVPDVYLDDNLISEALETNLLLVCWPMSCIKYKLEQLDGATWTPVTASVGLRDGSNCVSLTASRDTSFRLMATTGEAPHIDQGPASQMLALNSSLMLHVGVSGTPPFSYQWRLNGEELLDQTSATLVIEHLPLNRFGSYEVIVANACGSVISPPAVVTPTGLGMGMASDNFAQPAALRAALASANGSYSNTVVASNAGATKEMGEPNHAEGRGGSSIWFTWRAPEQGVATIKTEGSSFDTLLAVYTDFMGRIGGGVSNLDAQAFDDDTGEHKTSLVKFTALPGIDYHIAVDGWAAATGTVVLTWSLLPTRDVLIPRIRVQPADLLVKSNAAAVFAPEVDFGLLQPNVEIVNTSYTIPIYTGTNWIANHLNNGYNTLLEIMPTVPVFTGFYKFIGTNFVRLSDYGVEGWSRADVTLSPGEGAQLVSPTDFDLTITGQPVTPVLPLTIPGNKGMASRQEVGFGNYTNIIGTVPPEGATLVQLDAKTQTYTTNEFMSKQWSLGEPRVSIGESALITKPAGTIIPTASRGRVRSAHALRQVALDFQWRLNGVDLPGETDQNISIRTVDVTKLGEYSVLVTAKDFETGTVLGSTESRASSLQIAQFIDPEEEPPFAPLRFVRKPDLDFTVFPHSPAGGAGLSNNGLGEGGRGRAALRGVIVGGNYSILNNVGDWSNCRELGRRSYYVTNVVSTNYTMLTANTLGSRQLDVVTRLSTILVTLAGAANYAPINCNKTVEGAIAPWSYASPFTVRNDCPPTSMATLRPCRYLLYVDLRDEGYVVLNYTLIP